MAMPSQNLMGIRLFVTHVGDEGPFLKICGQLDQQAPLMIKTLFDQARENLENGIGAVPPGDIQDGVICAAKYKDGKYYRVKVINTTIISTGLVGVHFIDFGNRDIISLSTIRFLDKYDPLFLQLSGQANDFYLSRLIHPQGKWQGFLIQKLHSLLCYSEYPATIDSNTHIPLISVIFKGTDLSHDLAQIRFGAAIQIAQQKALLMSESQQASRQPYPSNESQLFQEHIPFLLNQYFPSNPASAMRLQQNTVLPFNNSVPPLSQISQRLQPNEVSMDTVNLKAQTPQPPCAVLPHGTLPGFNSVELLMKAPTSVKVISPKKCSIYESKLFEENSQHQVFVSYAKEGPELFAIQLVDDCQRLEKLMDDINKRPYSSLSEPPMIGTVCLGRMSGDRVICRAIVINTSGSQCKLFFVDFGDTEMVSYYDIFDIPEEFVKPNVIAMRFCLSGIKKLKKGPVLNETFKKLVCGQVMTLKVVPPEGPPLIQYGELYVDNRNVLDLLLSNTTVGRGPKPWETNQTSRPQNSSEDGVEEPDFNRDNNRDSHRDNHRDNRKNNRDNFRDNRDSDRFNPPVENNDGNRNRRNRNSKRRKRGVKKEGWGQKRDFRDQGEHSECPELGDRAEQSHGSELPNPTSLDTPFAEPSVEMGAQHEVSVSWIISPESFYMQILSFQAKFLEMMQKIPELYKGVKPLTGDIPVGATVLARYPVDGVLYRATVVSAQSSAKFIVRYVDFGNKQLVDARDIWQLDRSLLELPKMAIHCSLMGVMPKDGEWKADAEIDLCFNVPRYQCIFQECVDDVFKVSLWNNGVSVADTLVEKELAMMSEYQASVTLKDEPIDMTIVVGQQVMCRVTHVESFNHFYIQLDIEKVALVEQTIANYDEAKLTPPHDDIIIDGTHCTVKHEGKIYRAIMTDTSDKANIKAVLPDYGYTITISVENVMILPSDLCVYCYQSLHCTLNNYTEASNKLLTLEELKKRLTGNKFIVYMNDVAGITLLTTLYDGVTGHKVAIFEPDEGAYDEVLTLCMRSVFNYNFGMAYISHAENLNEIYLQRAGDEDALAELLDQLYKFYEEGTPEPLTTFEVDGLCVAQSSDTNWYRATILSVEDTQVKVQFSDYGNSETVPKESLKVLDKKFNEPCALALVASLGLVALQKNTLSKLLEWATEKEVQVTLSFGSDGWLANLHLDGVDLSMKLINEKLATPQVAVAAEEEKLPEEAAPTEEPISLPPGCTQVYISHIETPGHFWLQMLDKFDKIKEIQAELQVNAQSYPDIENREMGTPCVAKYLADEQWYRAEILDADADITTVHFVDYGNTDVLDNQADLIKAMPGHLNAIERFGIRASVNAVPTGTGEWSEAATESFTQLVGDLSNPVDSLIVLKDVTTYLDIFVGGQNITDKLVSEGHAARSEEAECGDLPSCFASHVNSASNDLQLMSYRLDGVPDDATLKEICRSKLDALDDLTLKTEILDSSKEPMLVKVLVDDKDVLLPISSEKPAEEISDTAENQDTVAIPELTEVLETSDILERKVAPETKAALKTLELPESVKNLDETDSLAEKEQETIESVSEAANDVIDAETVVETPISSNNQDTDGFMDAADELNISNELNDGIDSSHTVIKNKSFETDQLDAEGLQDKMDETFASSEKEISLETLENSNDTIKTGTPEKEESKESITDTGY